MTLRLELSDEAMAELVEQVAKRAALVVLERLDKRAVDSEFVNVDEAAEILRSSRQRVYDLASDGRLDRFKDGSRVLFRRADVVAHLRPSGRRSRVDRSVAR